LSVPAAHHLGQQLLVFCVGAVYPVDGSRFGEGGHFGYPVDQFLVANKAWGLQGHVYLVMSWAEQPTKPAPFPKAGRVW